MTAAQSAGDNAWMLVSAALVLMMTGPGLALFYGGLVRRKNTLAIMMQSFAMMGLISVLWAVVGYSLAFGGSGPVIGDFSHAFLRGVGVAPNPDYAGTIPQLTFMIYQMMFAVITPALITGATAERMKFSGTVLFHDAVVFCGVRPAGAHGLGQRRIFERGLGGRFPCLDFAGGTVVHISSGVSALVCALYMGKRIGFPKQADAAAQPGAQFYWRMPPVGGLVWIQRGQRTCGEWISVERVCGDASWSSGRGDRMVHRGMDQKWTKRARSARFPERWRDWWQSPRRPDSCGRCRQWSSDLSREFSAT